MSRISYLAAALIALQAVPSVLGVAFNVSSLPYAVFEGNDWNTIGPGLYKADSPNPADEDGTDPLDLFSTLFTVSGENVSGGTVTFNVPGSTLDLDYFVVKSGNEYAKYDTSSVDWSLYDSIVFSGFTPTAKKADDKKGKKGDPAPPASPKSISHISIYGDYTPGTGGGDPVPDTGWTLGLLGAGAAWLFWRQRK